MRILTMKFGGASVGSTAALKQMLNIVDQQHQQWDHVILVISALDGVTDALTEAAQLAKISNRRGYRRIVATLRTRHMALVEQLPLEPNEQQALQADIDRLLFDMLDVCQSLASISDTESPQVLAAFDEIIGVGERISARIIAALLRHNSLPGVALDATELIITDNAFGHANPLLEQTQDRITRLLMPMLSRDMIPVVTGFIGATTDGQPTTLGRGGSDYTAAILATCTGTQEVWMWTDVDGIMTGDPQQVRTPRHLPVLCYEEMAELAYLGAHIIHTRMIAPLSKHNIPLKVKNVFNPQHPGTLITSADAEYTSGVKAVTAIAGLGLYAPGTSPLTKITELVHDALHQATGSQPEALFCAQSAYSSFIWFTIPTIIGADAQRTIQNSLRKCLKAAQEEIRWEIQPVSVISVVGQGLNIIAPYTAGIFATLHNTPTLALAQGPSGYSLSLVVAPEYADSSIQHIHTAIINND